MSPEPRPTAGHPSKSARLAAKIAGAWLAAAWQDLWRRLWPSASLAATFTAVAMTDVLPSWPGWVHALILVAFGGALISLGARGLAGFKWPSRMTARTWLEAANADLHRPLTAIEDSPAAADTPFARALWQAHRDRANDRVSRLRLAGPQPGVAARDRWALRAGALVVLVIGLAGAGSDADRRLARALVPAFDGGNAALDVKLWITPPVYTNRSPVFVEGSGSQADGAARIDVPQGSKVLLVVTGTRRDTVLNFDGRELPLERMADESQRLEAPLPPVRDMALTQRGRVIAAWPLNPIPDLPPEIALVRPPVEAGRSKLRIDYRADDDYGIARVTGHVTAGPAIPPAVADQAFSFDLNTPPFNPKQTATASLHDLTAHPWAGFEVNLQLSVTDQAEQTATSDTVTVILPERAFNHPIARELAIDRKSLIFDYKQAVKPVFNSLSRILAQPDAFGGDTRVFLALSAARARIAFNREGTDVAPLADLLWQSAVRIEDGDLAAAEQRLEAAEQALREAMERGADPREISRLIDQLKRALAEYARELAARTPDSQMSDLMPPKDRSMLGPEDIADTMERLRQLSQMGAQDAARQALADLQQMLQSLRAAASADNDNAKVKQAQEIMKDLRELTGDQSQLLEQSFQKAREAALSAAARPQREQPGQQSGGAQGGEQRDAQGGGASDQQEQLRNRLGELMGRMAEMAGTVPDGLAGAEDAMRAARDALREGAWKPAADAQGEALAALQESLQQANDQLLEALAKQGMAGMMPMPGQDQRAFDPFGRRNGPENGEDVDLPAGPDVDGAASRVRQILEEIRRRAADRTRPPAEQDYLRRLMKQF